MSSIEEFKDINSSLAIISGTVIIASIAASDSQYPTVVAFHPDGNITPFSRFIANTVNELNPYSSLTDNNRPSTSYGSRFLEEIAEKYEQAWGNPEMLVDNKKTLSNSWPIDQLGSLR